MTLGPPTQQSLPAFGNWRRAPGVRARFAAGLHMAGCLVGFLGASALASRGQAGAAPPAERPPPPATPFVFPAHDSDLLALDNDMRAFFAARINDSTDGETRLRQIVAAILGEGGLHFTYEPDGNYSAAETYRRRRGNCVSLSFLAVAVARAHGLPAEFCEIDTYPRWDRHGNLITEIRHLNVRVRIGEQTFELDLLPELEREAPIATAEIVSDARAFAHYYNNLAVLQLVAGDATGAQALFDRALAADPTAAFVWANKGSALVRVDDLAAAEPCLDRAVRLNPAEHSALESLATLYARTARPRQAAALEKKVARYQLRNPYYLASLAQGEYDRSQFRDAEAHLRRAIRIKDDEPEFYELRILVAQKLDRTADAARWAAMLQEIRARPPITHFVP
jgi:tetratricopeptide (TPR) repeat protein